MSEQGHFIVIEEEGPDEGMHFQTEKQVSDRVDMSDCIDGRFSIAYWDGKKMQDVEIANYVKNTGDNENSIVSGWADLVLKESKEVVGTVTYTDH